MQKHFMDYKKYELDRLKKKSPLEHAKILEQRKQYRKEQGQKNKKQWSVKHPEKAKNCIRNANYKRKYGITLSEYNEMFLKQNGLCAICNRPEIMRGHKGEVAALSVDHCHDTGKVRSLLCRQCNVMLGGSRDNVDILLNAIRYLREHHGN